MPRMLKVVKLPGKSKDDGKKGKARKDRGKDDGKGKIKSKVRARGRGNKKLSLSGTPGQVELWFAYCGRDAEVAGVGDRQCLPNLDYSGSKLPIYI